MEIPLPESTIITLGSFNARDFTYLLWAAEHAQLLVIVGIVCGVLSLLLARSRLFVALMLGLGLLIAALVWWYVLLNHATLLPAIITGDPLLWPIAHEFLAKALADTKPIAMIVGVLGIVLVAVSIVGSSILAARRRAHGKMIATEGERARGDRSIRYDAYDA